MKKTACLLICFLLLPQLTWAGPSSSPFIRQIPGHLWKESKKISWGVPLVVLVLGGAVIATLLPLDKPVRDHFRGNAAMPSLDKGLNWVGSPYLLSGASVLTYGIGHITHSPEVKRAGEALSESLFLTGITTIGLKLVTNRERPNHADSLSFPSAHAAFTFDAASVITQLYGIKYGIPSYALAGLISFSRIDANDHHLTDVVFGATLGTVVGTVVARLHRGTAPDFMLVPTADNRQQGVALIGHF